MRYVFLALSLLAVVGCKTAYFIDSDPTGAEVEINGKPVGVTPVNASLPRPWAFSKSQTVTVRKEGFRDSSIVLAKGQTVDGEWYWIPKQLNLKLEAASEKSESK